MPQFTSVAYQSRDVAGAADFGQNLHAIYTGLCYAEFLTSTLLMCYNVLA